MRRARSAIRNPAPGHRVVKVLTGRLEMRILMKTGAVLMVMGAAGAAYAQNCADIADPAARLTCYDRLGAPRPKAAPIPAPAPAPAPRLPDPATVGKDQVPVPPEDRAFDPGAQHVAPNNLGLVVPPLRRIGIVPVRSGPGSSVPVVSLDATSLRPVPGDRWMLTLMLANNSGRDIDARILCTFRNGNRHVGDVAVLMRDIRPGEKVATDVAGPPVTDFVDSTPCRVLSPLE
ncbi:hypothetical protein [Vineibacter terrae]|uniref:hypothetical protein n=1 Tax=Vineibacter terrae TaxID=2586908 RepID=UPI002E355C1B|nr:hypothetical protein [Vineibacter terrae]